jgi:hypothetical protein
MEKIGSKIFSPTLRCEFVLNNNGILSCCISKNEIPIHQLSVRNMDIASACNFLTGIDIIDLKDVLNNNVSVI